MFAVATVIPFPSRDAVPIRAAPLEGAFMAAAGVWLVVRATHRTELVRHDGQLFRRNLVEAILGLPGRPVPVAIIQEPRHPTPG
jgi:hypothetical protein